MSKYVAYLDLLAFSNFVRENLSDAITVFENYNTTIVDKFREGIIHPADSYSNLLQEELAKRHQIGSFDNFLPFSDSIFIDSNNPNLFVCQLGNFILDCFSTTSDAYYSPLDPAKPYEIQTSDGKSIWYPALFRGGLAYGEVKPLRMSAIVDGKHRHIRNLAGEAVVRAVQLESKVKGPRIVFDASLYEQLDTKTKLYTYPSECEDLYELLWPAFLYKIDNGPMEIHEFHKLFVPAVNLWKAYRDTRYSTGYFNFVRLVIISTARVFDFMGEPVLVRDQIRESLAGQEIEAEFRHILD